MKKNSIISFLWVTIFCLSTVMAYGQNNLQKYYEYVNKAELAICRENYEEAGEFYKQAFAAFPPFGRDLHFASILQRKYLHNEEEDLKYAYLLRQMNHDIAEYFLYEEKELYPDLQKKVEMMQDTTKVLVIPELVEALEKLYDDDQKVRQNYLEYYPDDENYENHRNVMRVIDSVNVMALQALYQKYGEINERKAGMGFSHGAAYLVLLHNTVDLYNPDNIILEEVMKGNFDARWYMELKDRYLGMAEDTSYYETQNGIIVHNLFFLLEPEDVIQVNQNRKEINIAETWADRKEKLLHRFYEKNYDFRLCNIKSFYFGSDEENEKRMNTLKSEIDSGEVKGSYHTKE